MVSLKAGRTQYYEADEQFVNRIALFNFRNAKALASEIPKTSPAMSTNQPLTHKAPSPF